LLEFLHILEEAGDGLALPSAEIGSRFTYGKQLLVVTSTDLPALERVIDEGGGRILDAAGRVATVELSVAAIEQLAIRARGLLEVRLSRLLSPKIDRALHLSRVGAYRRRVAPYGRGRGVIIGVVDSGIDGTHPAFRGRILECWNQVAQGSAGAGLPYGRIEQGPSATDEDGHGTHVTGIAAGAEGVAPEASIICVKTDFEDAHVISGVRYIFRRASELGIPAVVNLSLGGHGDPHDGTDALSIAVDEASGPGRVVVAAAGNEGLDSIHFGRTIEPGTTHVAFRVPYHSSRVVANLWYDGGGEIEIAVSAPFGISTAYQPTLFGTKATQTYRLASLARIYITTPGVSRLNGDKSIRVTLQAVGPMVHPGRWFLHLRNRGTPVTVHAWTIDDSAWGDATWSEPSNSYLIGSPGAASAAITAAAMISRNQWTTQDGSEWSLKFDIGTVAPSSSRGPLRNGHEKPDFAVAGGMIIAPRSVQAHFDADGPIDDLRATMAGTSMAAAVLSGMCATLLERQPTWGPVEVRDALQQGARVAYSPDDGRGLISLDQCR
jgi:subtilisin family serine protease